jgi:hypothetical protein
MGGANRGATRHVLSRALLNLPNNSRALSFLKQQEDYG